MTEGQKPEKPVENGADNADLIKMIDDAYVHIYIVADSQSKTFDGAVLEALKRAHKNNMFIRVGLHHAGGEFSKTWQEIYDLSTSFHVDVPADKLPQGQEIVVADSTVQRTKINDKGEREVSKVVSWSEIDGVGAQFFPFGHDFLSRSMRAYRIFNNERLEFFAEAVRHRIETKSPHYFPISGRGPSYKTLLQRRYDPNEIRMREVMERARKEREHKDEGEKSSFKPLAFVAGIFGLSLLGCQSAPTHLGKHGADKNIAPIVRNVSHYRGK